MPNVRDTPACRKHRVPWHPRRAGAHLPCDLHPRQPRRRRLCASQQQLEPRTSVEWGAAVLLSQEEVCYSRARALPWTDTELKDLADGVEGLGHALSRERTPFDPPDLASLLATLPSRWVVVSGK